MKCFPKWPADRKVRGRGAQEAGGVAAKRVGWREGSKPGWRRNWGHTLKGMTLGYLNYKKFYRLKHWDCWNIWGEMMGNAFLKTNQRKTGQLFNSRIEMLIRKDSHTCTGLANTKYLQSHNALTIDSTKVLWPWEIKRRPNRPGDRYVLFACNSQQKMSTTDEVHHVYYSETDLKMLNR